MGSLRSVSYDGFVSLELDPKQVEGLGVPEVVFPHFLHSMERYTKKEHGGQMLYDNKSGTGKYVWKKDILIEQTFSQVLDPMRGISRPVSPLSLLPLIIPRPIHSSAKMWTSLRAAFKPGC